MLHSRKIVVLFGFAVLVGAAPSLADDNKAYGGVNCQPAHSNNTYDLGRGFFENTTVGGDMRAVCPVVRDEIFSVNGPTATMRVWDPSTTGKIFCDFYSMSGTGTSLHFQVEQTTDAQTGAQTLTFDPLISGNTARDHYFFSCLMPINARIYSYRVDEGEQTD